MINLLPAHLIGNAAEQKAKRYLIQKGLVFVTSNYRCRHGEIDLIFQQGEEWVFVEVKFRQNNAFGNAWDYFHAKKREKFTRAMQHFMHARRLNPEIVAHRIDLVAIQKDLIKWFKAI